MSEPHVPDRNQIESAVEAYLEQLEAGGAPDPTPFLSECPEPLRDELKQQLEAVQFLHRVGPQISSSPVSPDGHPEELAGYRIIRQLGHGAMGIVYLARRDEESAALKVLHANASLHEAYVKRFHNEGLIVSQLDHPHIVRLLEVGQEGPRHFQVLEYVSGESLANQVAQWKTAPCADHCQAAARWCWQIAKALQYAHQMGVLHRDVKPSNILLTAEGTAKLTDFGLAKNDESDLTQTGDILGTAQYMSPEQAGGRHALVDRRSDIFSLGATLYEATTLEKPFPHRTLRLSGHMDFQEAISPRKIAPDFPRDLETILSRALAPPLEQRYSTAGELAEDLERYLHGKPILAKRRGWPERLGTWVAQHRSLAATVAAFLVVLVGLLGGTSLIVWQAQQQTARALRDVEERAEEVEDLLYLSDVQRAYQAWDRQRPDEVMEILTRHVPEPDEKDRRGFAWHVLSQLATQPSPRWIADAGSAVQELAVLPGGEFVVTVGDEGRVNVWNTVTGHLEHKVVVGEKHLFAVAAHPQQPVIALGGTELTLWNYASGDLRQLAEYKENIESLAYAPNGNLALGSRYAWLRLFDPQGNMIREVPEGARHESLFFAEGGRQLVVPSRRMQGDQRRGYLSIWDGELTNAQAEYWATAKGDGKNVTYASMSPDGRYFAVSERYNIQHTRLVDTQSLSRQFVLPPHRDEVNVTCFSADGRYLAAAFNDGTISYWLMDRLLSGEIERPHRTYSIAAHHGPAKTLAFAGNSRLISAGIDGKVKAWDLAPHRNRQIVDSQMRSFDIATETGDLAVVCVESLVLANADGQVTHQHRPPGVHLNHVAVSSHREFIATTCFQRQVLELRDGRTGEVQHAIQMDSRINGVDFSPQGREVMAATAMGDLHFYDAVTGEERQHIDFAKLDGANFSAQYLEDGNSIVCGGQLDHVTLLNAKTKQIEHTLLVESHTDCFADSAKLGWLATGHSDGSIRLWQLSDGTLLHVLQGHNAYPMSLAFSPDGTTLASASKDGTTRLWSLTHFRPCGVLCRRNGAAADVGFSPDGRRLFTCFQSPPAFYAFESAYAP